MAQDLIPSTGAPAAHTAPRSAPPGQGGLAAAPEPARTLHYAREARFTRWADLPGGPALPDNALWDQADSRTVHDRAGEHRQRITAYALGPASLARVTMERPLCYNSDGRLTPAGPWAARSETMAVSGVSRLAPASGGGGPGGAQRAEMGGGRSKSCRSPCAGCSRQRRRQKPGPCSGPVPRRTRTSGRCRSAPGRWSPWPRCGPTTTAGRSGRGTLPSGGVSSPGLAWAPEAGLTAVGNRPSAPGASGVAN